MILDKSDATDAWNNLTLTVSVRETNRVMSAMSLVFHSEKSFLQICLGFMAEHMTVCGGHLKAQETVNHIYSHAKVRNLLLNGSTNIYIQCTFAILLYVHLYFYTSNVYVYSSHCTLHILYTINICIYIYTRVCMAFYGTASYRNAATVIYWLVWNIAVEVFPIGILK